MKICDVDRAILRRTQTGVNGHDTHRTARKLMLLVIVIMVILRLAITHHSCHPWPLVLVAGIGVAGS